MQNYGRDKKRIEEAKRKKAEEKRQKRFHKTDAPAIAPEGQAPGEAAPPLDGNHIA